LSMLMKEKISARFRELQDHICSSLEELDGKAKFKEDLWKRPGGGGGRTRVIENGNVFEKGGVNFSAVHGQAPEFIAPRNDKAINTFFATGVSIVIHPESPMVPVIHMNVRYLELNEVTRWFGGGIDITPMYVDNDDARYFHRAIKSVCDRFNENYYGKFKNWADDYFFIRHRNETRGAGGIFFDNLEPTTGTPVEKLFDFVIAVGESFAPVYAELVNRNRVKRFGEKEKEWQYLRRGRYAEFNLVYDRGTKFGLETDGRTESILMSLPPMAAWKYNMIPEPGSAEALTISSLRKGIDWIS
jgi:coproporphyrinogen III oxidase